MTEILYELLADDLPDLKGSELKAIIAIYSEGRYLGSRDMMNITGMARKTCLAVMESPHVQKAIKRVEDNPNASITKDLINQLRRELMKMELD